MKYVRDASVALHRVLAEPGAVPHALLIESPKGPGKFAGNTGRTQPAPAGLPVPPRVSLSGPPDLR